MSSTSCPGAPIRHRAARWISIVLLGLAGCTGPRTVPGDRLLPQDLENLYGGTPPDGLIRRIGAPTPSRPGLLEHVLLSRDGRCLIAAGEDRLIRIFDLSTGVVLKTLKGQEGWVWHEMALSADGKTLVTQDLRDPECVYVWDLESGRLKLRIPRGAYLADVAISPDGSLLALGPDKGSIHLRDTRTGEALPPFEIPEVWVASIAFSPDGRRILAGFVDGTALLFDVQTRALVKSFKILEKDGQCVSFAPDGSKFAMGGMNSAAVIGPEPGWPQSALEVGQYGNVSIIEFSSDGRTLATSPSQVSQYSIRVWDAASGTETVALDSVEHSGPPMLLKDGARLLACDGARVRTWSLSTGEEMAPARGHQGIAYWLEWADGGKSLISAGSDGTLRKWNAATGEERWRAPTSPGMPSCTGYVPYVSSGGGRIALSTDADEASIYELTTGKKLRDVTPPPRPLHFVVISPDGEQIAQMAENPLTIETVGTGALVSQFLAPKDPDDERGWNSQGLRFLMEGLGDWSPDGSRLVWRDGLRSGHFYDRGAAAIGDAPIPVEAKCARFSPDGTLILFGCERRASIVLDSRTFEPRVEFAGSDGTVGAAAWSPDGLEAALGDDHGRVRLYDAQSGMLIRVFQSQSPCVRAVAWSPDGDRVASAGDDGAIAIWDPHAAAQADPGAQDFDRAWKELRDPDRGGAVAAWNRFLRAGDEAALDLGRRLDAEWTDPRVGRWIRSVDANDPSERQSAIAALADAGVLAEPELRSASGRDLSPEARTSVGNLLLRLHATLVESPGSLRRLRALQALEKIGTPVAIHTLERLSRESPSLTEKRWAAESLQRARSAQK